MTEGSRTDSQLWFGKTSGKFGFGPITRQGRLVSILYVLLVVVAVFTYSKLSLTAFVIAFYTVVYGLIIVAKSNLMTNNEQDH